MAEVKAGGKKKNQKTKVTLSLQEFNKGPKEESGQWGDLDLNEEEEFDANTQSSSRDSEPYGQRRTQQRDNNYRDNNYRDNYPPRDNKYNRNDRNDRNDRNERNDREDRGPRKQNEIPEQGPYVAYVGNLSFSVVEDDIGEFFSENCKVENIRLIRDQEGKPRGHAYVTFAERQDLETALSADGYSYKGRPLRVDVSLPREGQNNRSSQDSRDRSNFVKNRFEPSRADTTDKWERGRVVAAKAESSPPPRQQRSNNNNERRENNYRRDDNREREEPRERKPLKLQPKSSSPDSDSASESDGLNDAQRAAKSNPFGEAKPRDEKAFEERRQREVAERKQKEDEPKAEEQPASESPSEVKEEKPANNNNNKDNNDGKYRAPRKNYNNNYNNNNRYNNNNNRNNNQKKRAPRNEADSDGFVPTSKSSTPAPQSNQSPSSSTPAASGAATKNKFSALSDQ